MESETIYGIFSGCYSDWSGHGYFNTLDEAEKYCAIKNSGSKDSWDKYYVINLEQIMADVSRVKLKCYHEVVFDFDSGMRQEPKRYEYYTGNEERSSKITYNTFRNSNGWISFQFNCESREKAEKIAQDRYSEFLVYYSENGTYEKAAKLIGANRM